MIHRFLPLIALITLTSVVQAQRPVLRQSRWSIGLSHLETSIRTDRYVADQEIETRHGSSTGLRFEWGLTRGLSVVVDGTRGTASGAGNTFNLTGARAGLCYRQRMQFGGGVFTPYVEGALSGGWIDQRNVTVRPDAMPENPANEPVPHINSRGLGESVGAGVTYSISRAMSARAGATYSTQRFGSVLAGNTVLAGQDFRAQTRQLFVSVVYTGGRPRLR